MGWDRSRRSGDGLGPRFVGPAEAAAPAKAKAKGEGEGVPIPKLLLERIGDALSRGDFAQAKAPCGCEPNVPRRAKAI